MAIDLRQWANAHATNINGLLVGDEDREIRGVYRGVKEGVNAWGAEALFFQIEVEGKILPFTTGAIKIALSFENIEEGSEVIIKRIVN